MEAEQLPSRDVQAAKQPWLFQLIPYYVLRITQPQ